MTARQYKTEYASHSDQELWDGYVQKHPDASLFHLYGWRKVIHETYGHATYYLMLMACNETVDGTSGRVPIGRYSAESVQGVLPLVHFKNAIFGNSLVSMPFLDGGGILASDKAAADILLSEVIQLGYKIGASRIELRHEHPLSSCDDIDVSRHEHAGMPLYVATKSDKVRMLLKLPGSSQLLAKSFKSKLKNQINKPLKEGLTAKTGGAELLDDFYSVFLANMRDLGSPVHSLKLMRHAMSEFSENSSIIVVYKSGEPLAAALVIGFQKVLRNPWASSLRKYAPLSPNMLLYLRMLEYACDHGYQVFDFGRSSVGEGTYKFKEQWGAEPEALHWHYIALDGRQPDPDSVGKEKFATAVRYWKKLPLLVTKLIGPSIRKHISL